MRLSSAIRMGAPIVSFSFSIFDVQVVVRTSSSLSGSASFSSRRAVETLQYLAALIAFVHIHESLFHFRDQRRTQIPANADDLSRNGVGLVNDREFTNALLRFAREDVIINGAGIDLLFKHPIH